MNRISSIFHTAKNDWHDGRGKILVVTGVGWSLSVGMRLSYPVLLPYIQTAYNLTLTTAGLLLTILWLAYAFGQLPGGFLADQIGEGRTMIISMMVASVALGVVIVGESAPILYMATGLFGLGTALFGVVRFSILSGAYPDRLGTAVGLVSAGGDVGNTVLPPISGLIAAALVWQLGFGYIIPLYIIVAFTCWSSVPRHISGPAHSGATFSLDSVQRIFAALRRRPVQNALIIQIFGVFVWNSFTGIYPTYLIQVKNISSTAASGLFALFFALGIVIKPLSGTGYDNIGTRRSLAILTGFSGVGLFIVPLANEFWKLAGITILLSLMLGRGTIVLSYLTNTLSEDVLNTGLGSIRTTYMTIGATGPAVMGMLADRGFFNEAFYLLGALSGATIIAILLLPEDG